MHKNLKFYGHEFFPGKIFYRKTGRPLELNFAAHKGARTCYQKSAIRGRTGRVSQVVEHPFGLFVN
jgi:hypothetical protein